MRIRLIGLAVATLLAAAAPAAATFAASAPTSWDDLVRVKSRALDSVYLLPGVDFRPYTKVMIDPAEVAFRKGWLRDYNASTSSLAARLDESDAERMAAEARTGFDGIVREAFAAAGYEIVDTPGADVLRVSPSVFNLAINAPDVPSAGRVSNWSVEAGEASVLVEVRDSTTGALLGRAVDRARLDDGRMTRRTEASNRADFEQLFRRWSATMVNGLAQLKALSPISASGTPARP
ncbi:MAG TPA: DUF3313 family protein [Caulobacter sp.]|nr:DUF3313 family protein [Caulobacter sp.]